MMCIRLSSSRSSLRIQGSNMSMALSNKKQKMSILGDIDNIFGDIDNLEDKSAASTETVNDSTIDWREHKNILDIHIHALEEKHLTDVNFIVGEEKVPFSAHRLILALGSPVFEAMFFGGLAEKGDFISIPDVDPKAFDFLLRFLYGGGGDFENDAIAFKIFFAADKYCVMNLIDRSETYLAKRKLKPSRVWAYLENSIFLNSQKIRDRCLTFLRLSTKAALESNSFLDATTTTVETFLSLDSMNVLETGLILHLIRWAEHKSRSETDPIGSFPCFFMPLLRLVRFSSLSHQDFVHLLEMPKLKDVLSGSDALAILKSIVKPAVCSLPDWCCKKKRDVSLTIELNKYDRSSKNLNQCHSKHCRQNRNKRKREKPQEEITDISSCSDDSSNPSFFPSRLTPRPTSFNRQCISE